MTQKSIILSFFEKICRSNIYLFIISRFIVGKFFSKIVYDNDFKVIKILEEIKFFNKKS